MIVRDRYRPGTQLLASPDAENIHQPCPRQREGDAHAYESVNRVLFMMHAVHAAGALRGAIHLRHVRGAAIRSVACRVRACACACMCVSVCMCVCVCAAHACVAAAAAATTQQLQEQWQQQQYQQ